ncbi:hypothetical protein CI109_104133 [Kwoniella shandongensis]|uniref:Uncharacterized protein n=1 Tax=Kwoniella shandongensis TaxID=1734106 RepID=A0A5M6C1B4_9TREE|nr:uncharacterized protein CI109_002954 [Kwoniella shandongensis]KAA5528794.1 hypothetical protein CI109_002954 [Kwoniella shandongensis]
MSSPGPSLTANPISLTLPLEPPPSTSIVSTPPPMPSSLFDPTTDPTLTHLLSLPSVLALSPPHQALHLARLRLILQIPTTPTYGTLSSGGGMGGWCHLCGGLRAGLGGAQRGGRGTKKGSEIDTVIAIAERDGLTGIVLGRKRKRPDPRCTTCGTLYVRPKPDPATLASFPPARKTRRLTRIASASAKAVETIAIGTASVNPEMEKEVRGGLSKEEEDSTAQLGGLGNVISANNATSPLLVSGSTSIPNKPSILEHRSLSHIPTSSPNLPTYPQPPPTKSPSPQLAGPVPKGVKAAIGAGANAAAGQGVKRKKKSGLAKLLAENKEREQVNKGQGGMWGF